MTYEEAIKVLAEERCKWCVFFDEEEQTCMADNGCFGATKVAIECIKKQMPKPKKKTDLNGKCGSCKYATPNETHFGCSPCYIICKKPGKVFRTNIAHVKQRTNKACKGYEMKAVSK